MKKIIMKMLKLLANKRLALITILFLAGLLATGFYTNFHQAKIIPVAQANYGSVTVTDKAANKIKAYCGESPDLDLCKNKNYPADLVAETYKKMSKDIPDLTAKANIRKIQIMGQDEVTQMCGLSWAPLGCWDTRDIGYAWEIFTYPKEESYQYIAHEILHAFATGTGFNVQPFDEGLVDNLAMRLPSIALKGGIDLEKEGNWNYTEMRDIADKVVGIYKLQGKGTDQNAIMLDILRNKSNGLNNVLGDVELTNTLTLDSALRQKNGTVRCTAHEQAATKRAAVDELRDRTYCLFYDDKNFQDFYHSSLDLLEKVKSKIPGQGKTDNEGPKAGFSTAVFPELIKEEQKMDVKFSVTKEPTVKSVFVAITKPNPTLSYSKDLICRLITMPEATTASNGFYAISNQSCPNGECNDTYSLNLPKTEINNNYKIKVISFTTSDSPGMQNCNGANIVDIKEQEITVDKGTKDSSTDDTGEYGTMKGTIRVSAPQSISQGDGVMVNVSMKDHQNDEFMLWITDCDGTLVPKILMSDHQARTVPSNDFVYHYPWDTKAAQTKACKHTVQVKTFAKNSSGKWVWNDQAKYEITVGTDKVDSKLVCIMQLETLVANENKVNSSGATGNTDTEKNAMDQDDGALDNNDTEKNAMDQANSYDSSEATGNTDTEQNAMNEAYGTDSTSSVSGNKVMLNWNGICSAQKYIIYRDDKYVGDTTETTFTDTVSGPGTYTYRVDAYLDSSTAPNYNDAITDDQNQIFDNTSWDRLLQKIKLAFWVGQAKALNGVKPPQTSKTVKVNVTPVTVVNKGNINRTNPAGSGANCGNGIPLGVPIPVRDPNGSGFYLKYCAASMADYMETLYSVLIVIAVISALLMIIYGGYMYVTSQGNAQKLTAAKEIIIGALIGLALLLSAGLIISSIGIN